MVSVYGMSHAPALLLLDLPRLSRPRRVPGALPRRRRRRGAARPGSGEPAPAATAGRARDQPLVLVARLRRRRRRRGARRAAALSGRRRSTRSPRPRWAAIAGAAGTLGEFVMKALQARRRRAQLERPPVGHRRGRPARPRRAALLRRAGVLPLGALAISASEARAPARSARVRFQWRPCASSASTPAFARPASASSIATAPALHYVASGTIRTARGRAGRLPGAAEGDLRRRARAARPLRAALRRRSRSSSSTSIRSRRCCSARRAARRSRRSSRASSRSPNTPRCR